MADWTDIPNTSLEPDAPVRSIDALAFRDNPIAIAEGASGAPKVEDLALDTTATNTGRNWVLARTALSSVGAVGTYAMLVYNENVNPNPGHTASGSFLKYTNTSSSAIGANVSGTWRLMGHLGGGIDAPSDRVSMWLRIS